MPAAWSIERVSSRIRPAIVRSSRVAVLARRVVGLLEAVDVERIMLSGTPGAAALDFWASRSQEAVVSQARQFVGAGDRMARSCVFALVPGLCDHVGHSARGTPLPPACLPRVLKI